MSLNFVKCIRKIAYAHSNLKEQWLKSIYAGALEIKHVTLKYTNSTINLIEDRYSLTLSIIK